ncbi:hypothetical protein [Luteibacter sp. 329MFSha]|uniref:hypothetical protein n=1 Tax=Luteibacter sp. 329MFSha TaxID=1798239 RepID=UPI0008B94255|nr:hypothetical protein [Luteibacter sp. 329MFSha]SEW12561.1 hypothetical protein SAMN04515660_2357 [Luteibacter sp. 329MFSha]
MPSRLRAALPWVVIVIAAIVATWVRYGFIEPPHIAYACEAGHGPWWCGTRNLIVLGFLSYGYGYAAAVAALVSLFLRSTVAAVVATSLGVVALQLYCYEAGAFALLIGALRLVRVQVDRAHPAVA